MNGQPNYSPKIAKIALGVSILNTVLLGAVIFFQLDSASEPYKILTRIDQLEHDLNPKFIPNPIFTPNDKQ